GAAARVWDAATGRPLGPLLKCAKYSQVLRCVGFSADGQSLLAFVVDNDGIEVQSWNASADDRPTDNLLRLTWLLSGHRLDEGGAITPVPDEELHAYWQQLRRRYPNDFAVSPKSSRAWRQREIIDSIREGELRAARFHFGRLVAEVAGRSLN